MPLWQVDRTLLTPLPLVGQYKVLQEKAPQNKQLPSLVYPAPQHTLVIWGDTSKKPS